MRWARHVACMGENQNAYQILVGNPEGKTQLEKCKWEDNIDLYCLHSLVCRLRRFNVAINATLL
jgi:hypothetical protein